MAETVGAVASIAGLVSLSMQLVESAQKLKRLYTASRDAPSTVADLCFELEAMSLSLRHLSSHRNADVLGDQLLGRCVTTCTRMVTKIEETVSKIERLLQRSRVTGRVYLAFKEPEIDRLLVELEHAKSSMSFAYMSYCHSWSVGEAMKHAVLNTAQSAILSAQNSRLQTLEHNVQTGHANILARLDEVTDHPKAPTPVSYRNVHVQRATNSNTTSGHRGKRSAPKFRISLPSWLIDCTWDFGFRRSESGWDFQIYSVNVRPRTGFTFDVVRSGSVPGVRALLASKELSIRDHFPPEPWAIIPSRDLSIFELAAEYGRLDLCELLLAETGAFRSDTAMCSAIQSFLDNSIYRGGIGRDFNVSIARQELDRLYHLFVKRYGMTILSDEQERHPFPGPNHVTGNTLLTDESVRTLLASQSIPFSGYSFDTRFEIAMSSHGWPAETFLDFLKCEDDPLRLARKTDSWGRTALHWATEHLSYWMISYWTEDFAPDNAQVDSYAALIVELVSKGADLHALDADRNTPFTKLVRQGFYSNDNFGALRRLCARWLEVLQESNCSLSSYVEAENDLQKLVADERRIEGSCLSSVYSTDLCEMRLLLLEDAGLSIEIKCGRDLRIEEFRPPPGAWQVSDLIPRCIYWYPYEPRDTEPTCFRHMLKTVRIYSEFHSIQSADSSLFYSDSEITDRWMTLFRLTQDDHGQVAMLLLQDGKRFARSCQTRRRRAASAAPPATTVESESPDFEPLSVPYRSWVRTSFSCIHRCVLDSKWKTSRNDSKPQRSLCMQGRCNSTWSYDFQNHDHWEAELFRDLDKVDVALRYADRFHPELRPIFEAEFEKTRRWAELGEKTSAEEDVG